MNILFVFYPIFGSFSQSLEKVLRISKVTNDFASKKCKYFYPKEWSHTNYGWTKSIGPTSHSDSKNQSNFYLYKYKICTALYCHRNHRLSVQVIISLNRLCDKFTI